MLLHKKDVFSFKAAGSFDEDVSFVVDSLMPYRLRIIRDMAHSDFHMQTSTALNAPISKMPTRYDFRSSAVALAKPTNSVVLRIAGSRNNGEAPAARSSHIYTRNHLSTPQRLSEAILAEVANELHFIQTCHLLLLCV